MSFGDSYRGRRVLVTGDTGFKGSWLCLWLDMLGAEVHGLGLPPDTTPSLFHTAQIGSVIQHHDLDIRRADSLIAHLRDVDPEIVFHLAAQSLVRRSYETPLETFDTNVMGTANVLEACRRSASTRAVVCVTTDKVYRNNEWVWPYRESDPLEGKDPYSASKAAAEIVASCYRQTMAALGNGAAIATVRGGNVIGGGDWSEDRLVPDLVRAIVADQPLTLRQPEAVRPWQHVLALCHGYLDLGVALEREPRTFEGAWNFGPGSSGTTTVAQLLKVFGAAWQLPDIRVVASDGKPEATLLALDSSKSEKLLGWKSPWSLDVAVSETAAWYKGFVASPGSAQHLMRNQIDAYAGSLGT